MRLAYFRSRDIALALLHCLCVCLHLAFHQLKFQFLGSHAVNQSIQGDGLLQFGNFQYRLMELFQVGGYRFSFLLSYA
jgi:hypothetical protein